LPRAVSCVLEVVFWLCSPARSEEGAKAAIQVACRRGWRHDHRMERDRTKPPTLDLFSTHVVQDGSPPIWRASPRDAPADIASQRHILPKDLPNAVKYLTDRELDLLITASVQEAKRRGRLSPRVQPNPTDEPVRKQWSSRDKRQAEVSNVSLTRGQVNAVRAATKAGIKPSQIARQFGISQSDVRKVLASDTNTQKGR
jgi:predicted DNA-binding protein (UPF0251 family)